MVADNKKPHWSTASHDPTGQASDPATTPEAVVQVYAARTWGWRGAVAVHTWISLKPKNSPYYTRYEVIGWRAYFGRSPLGINAYPPDAEWFSNRPELLADIRGLQAETIIPKIQQAVRDYPFAENYRTWPGPNSNTFVAHIVRAVPDFNVDLPVTAIGKDYLAGGVLNTRLPGGKGLQLSLGGYVGFLVGLGEGLEINFFGAAFGIGINPPALKLPGVGRVGLK